MDSGIAYFGSRILRHVEADLDEIAAAGYRHVLHTFSEGDQRYYLDQMVRIVEATHARGLTATAAPFGVAGIFGGEEASFFLAEHPRSRQRDEGGRIYPAACLRAPATRALIDNWLADAAAVGFDEILWDEPGWAFDTREHRRCSCDSCRDAPELDAEQALVAFLAESIATAAALDLRNTVCLLPDELALTPGQPWREVAAIPGLDALSTDPYWKNAYLPVLPFVPDSLLRLRAAIGDTSVALECWIQGFGLDLEDERDFVAATLAARGEGASRVWFWGFGAAAHMSELGESSPEAVWEYMKEVARRLAMNELS